MNLMQFFLTKTLSHVMFCVERWFSETKDRILLGLFWHPAKVSDN